MKRYQLKIFCDFDGTVTKNDVWVNSLGKFIEDKDAFQLICDQFSKNQITSRECIKKELDLVKNFDTDTFDRYLETEEIDDYFCDFKKYCDSRGFEIILLSEGLDYYINKLLNKSGISLKFYSNKLIILKNTEGKTKLTCDFPYSDENCSFCGMSKRNILMSNTDEMNGEISVFIGDGVSDFCVSNYADIVFAKKALASYCWKNNITYYDYKNFNDILNKIQKMEQSNKIKQKQTARMLRRDVYLGG